MIQSEELKKKFIETFTKLIAPYKIHFEEQFKKYSASKEYGVVEELQKATEYALKSGGKRFRPAIVWMVGTSLGKCDMAHLDRVAFCVEYFHTSSLIADDLPCMDDDDFRRGVLTTHKAFSEATAVLVSFSLIALGFQAIVDTPLLSGVDPEITKTAIRVASQTMGASGLLGGQSLDLNPPNATEETINQIIDMKTGALFDLSFTLGWLFGGGEISKLDLVHRLARSFGRAFQILDDVDDIEKDTKSGKIVNFALAFGRDAAIKKINEYVEETISLLDTLGIAKTKTGEDLPITQLTRILSQHAAVI